LEEAVGAIVCHGPNYIRKDVYDAEFEVLTAVVMKITIFCDITPYIPLKVNRLF
jgi:hypothetical protein